MSQNPFVEEFNTFDSAIPFDRVETSHYLPALKHAIEEARKNIETLKSSNEEPTFENTIVALETSSDLMGAVSSSYYSLLNAEADDEFHQLAPQIGKMLSEFSSDISLDEGLFVRVKAVYDKKMVGLNDEQEMLLTKTYKSFARNGALLDTDKKQLLRKIDSEMAELSPKFSQNVLKATYAEEFLITDKEELDGLPDSVRESARHAAEAKDYKEGWLFTMEFPSFMPFMQNSKRRELREKIWREYAGRCLGGDFDNGPVIRRIIELRHERAQLLGYKFHADYVLEERMAQGTQTVFAFLEDMIGKSRSAADRDMQDLKDLAKKMDGVDTLYPWDTTYYSERLREERFNLSDEEIRPYFPLDQAVAGAFDLAQRLYGLEFEKVNDIPKYHEQVDVYKVHDKNSGNYMGLFYTDFFPRPTKKGGAWMTEYREQGLSGGQVCRPHVSIVCNFNPPTKSRPSLLNFMELETLFHEFGHALHGLLSECTYPTVSGTNVYWDFVELPSQFMENWLLEKEVLDTFAAHYKTGKKIPEELVHKLKMGSQFQSGYHYMRQLNFAWLDMNWHSRDPKEIPQDIVDYELAVTEKTRLMEKVEGTCASTSFAHIFAGGYSAGYYSYKWAEVLEADAFAHFKENGLFSTDVAKSFRENVLARGGTEHPMELYKKFRGREPDPNALLKRDGLI